MQVSLEREFTSIPGNLPSDYKPYRVLYWFKEQRLPSVGTVIYLPDSKVAKAIEGVVNGMV